MLKPAPVAPLRQRRTASIAPVVALDPRSSAPLQTQVYEAIRGAILDGRLRGGAKVPSTRALAEQLDVSRNTVAGAFAQLWAEGYLVGRVGSGTYVAEQIPDRSTASRQPRRTLGAHEPVSVNLSQRGRKIVEFPSPGRRAIATRGAAFLVGCPALDQFPVDLWAKLLNRRWRFSADELLGHHDAQGYLPLREAIAEYLASARGVRCTPEQVIVVSGTQQALALTGQVLLDPGDAAWVEDPGYHFARAALTAAGATLVPVPVDAEGANIAAGIRACSNARLAVFTPFHQLPLGVTMSLPRRMELLEWARRQNAWIFEDDYDSEFRYAGRPLAALQGLDGGERVIYAGTFSKVLAPTLRLGYVVAPRPLVPALVSAKLFADVHTAPLGQAVLADFMAGGHFARHIRRMRKLYAQRQELLVSACARDLKGLLEVKPADAGMHLVGWLPPGVNDRDAARRAAVAGIAVEPLSAFRIQSRGRGALLLGYASVPEDRIADGVRRLRDALRA
jgi:GntR family transcriptional regulator / MocR family aminotransferase